MKSRLSIEIKGLLEPKKLGLSRYDPECSAALTAASSSAKPLKRSESTSTLRRTDTENSLIQDRYRALENNYRELLEETKAKGELFRKQREEVHRLRQAHDRDQKEIAQLRSLIEIARRIKPPSTRDALQRNTLQTASAKPERPASSAPKEGKSPAGRTVAAGVCVNVGGGLRKSRGVRGQQGWTKYKFVPSLPLQ